MNYIEEYRKMFNNLTITKQPNFECSLILNNKSRYESVAQNTNIPWYVIGALNVMEGNGKFTTHLANGDPLSKPTVHVPANIPPGTGPFTWEESAIYILNNKKKNIFKDVDWTDIGCVLNACEMWNGTGYRNKNIWSPYLFCGTNYYTKGKYVKDGPDGWDPNAVSQQSGIATMLKKLIEMGKIDAFKDISINEQVSPNIETPQDSTPPSSISSTDCLISAILDIFKK